MQLHITNAGQATAKCGAISKTLFVLRSIIRAFDQKIKFYNQ
jgi:hypothetical protein